MWNEESSVTSSALSAASLARRCQAAAEIHTVAGQKRTENTVNACKFTKRNGSAPDRKHTGDWPTLQERIVYWSVFILVEVEQVEKLCVRCSALFKRLCA